MPGRNDISPVKTIEQRKRRKTMGQYYIPTLIAGDDTVSTLYSHQYDNGLKLMEH